MARVTIDMDPLVFNVLVDLVSLVSVLLTVLLLELWKRNSAWLYVVNGAGFNFDGPGVVVSGKSVARWSIGWWVLKFCVLCMALAPLAMEFVHVAFDLNVDFEQVVIDRKVEGFEFGSRGGSTPRREITCAWMKSFEDRQTCLRDHPFCTDYYLPEALATGLDFPLESSSTASKCPTVRTEWNGDGPAPPFSPALASSVLDYYACRNETVPIHSRYQVVDETLEGRNLVGYCSLAYHKNWREELSTGRTSFDSSEFPLTGQDFSLYPYPLCLLPLLNSSLLVTGGVGFEVLYRDERRNGFTVRESSISLALNVDSLFSSSCAEIVNATAVIHYASKGEVADESVGVAVRPRLLTARVVSRRSPDQEPETFILSAKITGDEVDYESEFPIESKEAICRDQDSSVPPASEYSFSSFELPPNNFFMATTARELQLLSCKSTDPATILDDLLGNDTLLVKGRPLDSLTGVDNSGPRSIVRSGVRLASRAAQVTAGVQEVLPTATPVALTLWIISFVPFFFALAGVLVSYWKRRHHPAQPVKLRVPIATHEIISEWSKDVEGGETVMGIQAGDRSLRCRPTRTPADSRSIMNRGQQPVVPEGHRSQTSQNISSP